VKVQPLITSENKTRYILVDNSGEPVEPVLKFIKFKDNSGSARNTLRTYCYHLKLYFEFLEQKEINYRNVGIDEMAEFLRWLQNPFQNVKITSLQPMKPIRKPRTVNAIVSTTMVLYDYLMRHDDFSIQLSERLKKQISGSRRGFKDFLYHINKDKMFDAKILKLKEPKDRPKTIDKEGVHKLIDACINVRDRFIVQLLWESGMRIGEMLALFIEDFEIDARRIHIRDRGELINLAEIKTAHSARVIDISDDLINLYLDYIAEIHTDEVDTNHVFIKLSGVKKNQPLEYHDIDSLFKRLRRKTGIYITPHMLRHSSLTELHREGWRAEYLRKRAGHTNLQTTMQIYIHPSDEDIRKDWEKVENRMKIKKQRADEDEDIK
jgi:integrase/recombinase XerD